MDTWCSAYFYHPTPGIARRWCATPDDRNALLIEDARWRDTPCKLSDILVFFEEHGIYGSESRMAWCAVMVNVEEQGGHAKGPFTYRPWWDGASVIIPSESVMVAREEFIDMHSQRWLSVGEVFETGSRRDPFLNVLIRSGSVVRAVEVLSEGGSITARHHPTGSFWLTAEACTAHAEGYARFIRASMVPAAAPLLSVAPSSETVPQRLVQYSSASPDELGRIARAVLGSDTAWNRGYIYGLWTGGTLTPPAYPRMTHAGSTIIDPVPDTALTPASDDSPQPAPASLRKSDTTGRRGRGRQTGSGNFVGHEIEVIKHVIELVKKWRSNPDNKKDPSQKDICKAEVWGSIFSPFTPHESSLYKCLKVYGKSIGRPEMIWKTFLDSIPRESLN